MADCFGPSPCHCRCQACRPDLRPELQFQKCDHPAEECREAGPAHGEGEQPHFPEGFYPM